MKRTLIAASLFCAAPVFAVPITPYKGPGGLIEVFGTVTAAFYTGWRGVELCGRFSALKNEADRVKAAFIAANQPVFIDAGIFIETIALKDGGENELKRLRTEVKAAVGMQKEMDAQLMLVGHNETTCRSVINNVGQGRWDLKRRHLPELLLLDRAANPDRY